MMIVERRQKLPNENTGYKIERRQHRRQTGTHINHDFALQNWDPRPDIKKVKAHPVLKVFLCTEILLIAAVFTAAFAGWLS